MTKIKKDELHKKTVAYIIPVHNESKFLISKIELLLNKILKNKLSVTEIILVENGSTDNSWKLCLELSKKYKKIKAKKINSSSFGLAIRHGMLSSNSDILVVFNTNIHRIKIFENSKYLKTTINNVISKHDLFITELIIKLKNSLSKLHADTITMNLSKYATFTKIKNTSIDVTRIFFYYFFSKTFNNQKALNIADDYGLDTTTNNAILDLYNSKSIDIVSVLPNLVTKKELTKLKNNVPNQDIAVHINLLNNKPISDIKKIPTLISKQKKLYSLEIFLLRLLFKKINLKEIELEIENQIKHLLKSGIKLNHLNSEQHHHIFAPVNQITHKLAKKYKIKHIRNLESIKYYLSWKIHKYLILIFFTKALNLVYGLKPQKPKVINEIISHPGSNYD